MDVDANQHPERQGDHSRAFKQIPLLTLLISLKYFCSIFPPRKADRKRKRAKSNPWDVCKWQQAQELHLNLPCVIGSMWLRCHWYSLLSLCCHQGWLGQLQFQQPQSHSVSWVPLTSSNFLAFAALWSCAALLSSGVQAGVSTWDQYPHQDPPALQRRKLNLLLPFVQQPGAQHLTQPGLERVFKD